MAVRCSFGEQERSPMARILIVEDEDDIRLLSCRLLMLIGHEVEAASSGEEAIVCLRRHPYDVVLTDIGLPGMDGWAVARFAKSLAAPPAVGLVSGWAVVPNAHVLQQAGVDFLLNKPYSLDEVEDKLKQYE